MIKEEAEVKKDIEWLKEKVLELQNNGNVEVNQTETEREIGRLQKWAWDNCADRVYELINQLDEPEVLSQEWIDEHKVARVNNLRKMTMDDVVPVEKLQGLLMPKQELPVIPNYVAKWISEHHERFDLYPALKRLENNALDWGDVYDWYRKNTRKFVNAYLTGKYEVEVEEEQKYYVILEENSYGAMGLGIGREGRLTFTATHDKWSLPKLTEQEIKDYDERYWPFAVKVEELEE